MTTENVIFFVNGAKQVASPSPDKTLLQYLRQDLRLTGTKLACGQGACGACTVTLSRLDPSAGSGSEVRHCAVNACVTRVAALHATAITTVEGLGATDRPGGLAVHPVQERLYKSHGSQCGFCSPGMVMSMSSMLRQKNTQANSTPDIEDVYRKGILCLQGNLCRCTGYGGILDGMKTFCNGSQKQAEAFQDDNVEVLTPNLSEFKPYTASNDPEVPLREMQAVDSLRLELHDADSQRTWIRPLNLADLKRFLTSQSPEDNVLYVAGGTGTFKCPSRWASQKAAKVLVHIAAVKELQNFSVENSAFVMGATLTLDQLEDKLKAVEVSSGGSQLARVLLRALATLGSSQLRGVATVGGAVLWGHACSDLMPILMASGATLNVLVPRDGNNTEERTFAVSEVSGLPRGSLLLSVTIPIPDEDVVIHFFRQARRKDFDLAIANGCFMAKVRGEDKIIRDVHMAIGGLESPLLDGEGRGCVEAGAAVNHLEGKAVDAVPMDPALMATLLRDLPVRPEAPGTSMELRQSIYLHHVGVFLSKCRREEAIIPDTTPASLDRDVLLQYERNFTASASENEDPVHRPVPHQWAAEQACGEAQFLDDIAPQVDEVRVVLVQSSRAHADVVTFDTSEALKVPGVIDILTHKDLTRGRRFWGLTERNEPIFATVKVAYYGQIMAAIICESEKAGKEARGKIRIEYRDLEPLYDLKAARARNEIFGSVRSLARDQKIERKGAEVHRVRGEVHVSGQEHFYMEPHCALAYPLKEKGEMVVYLSSQEPTNSQTQIAHALNVARHKVVVRTKRVGGAFGGKERMHVGIIAALAARKAQRSARLVLTRSQDMAVTGGRHECTVSYDVEANELGQLLKTDFRAVVNAGASTDLSVVWAEQLLVRMGSAYTFTNYRGEAAACRTSTASNTALRSFSAAEGAVVVETAMDHVAFALGLDPVAVREANLTADGDRLHYADAGAAVRGATLGRCWAACKAQAGYGGRRAAADALNARRERVKRGLALVPMQFAPTFSAKSAQQAAALVHIYVDGSVLVAHGGTEMGQGLNTKMLQVAATALGVPLERVHIRETSTETIPNATPTGGSTGADMNGAAIMDACERLNERLRPFKWDQPEARWEDWVGSAYAERVNLSATGIFDSSKVDFDFAENSGVFTDYYTFGAGCVEVEVNCATAEVSVIGVDVVMDLGKSLNPAIDIGQIEGAFLQGMGGVTMEQKLYDTATGRLLTDGPATYKIPLVSDVPKRMRISLLRHDGNLEDVPTSAVYSSKGVGEPNMIAGAAGTIMAIRDAVAAYRKSRNVTDWFHFDAPASADAIRMACQDAALDTINDFNRDLPKHGKIAFQM